MTWAIVAENHAVFIVPDEAALTAADAIEFFYKSLTDITKLPRENISKVVAVVALEKLDFIAEGLEQVVWASQNSHDPSVTGH